LHKYSILRLGHGFVYSTAFPFFAPAAVAIRGSPRGALKTPENFKLLRLFPQIEANHNPIYQQLLPSSGDSSSWDEEEVLFERDSESRHNVTHLQIDFRVLGHHVAMSVNIGESQLRPLVGFFDCGLPMP
jgi:hypothetical protein